MQVRHDVKNLTPFSVIDYGDVFRASNGDILIKINPCGIGRFGFNAINVKDGRLYNFDEQNAEFELLEDAVLTY